MVKQYEKANLLKNYDVSVEVKRLLSKARILNFNHSLHCPCCEIMKDNLKEEHLRVTQKKFDDGEIDQEKFTYESHKAIVPDRVSVLFNDYCQKGLIICPYEADIILDTVETFDGVYDLSSPQVHVIVSSVVNNFLTAYRLELINKSSSLVYTTDKGTILMHPAVEARRRADESVVNSMKVLNELVYGTKSLVLNADVSGNVIPFESLFSPSEAQKHAKNELLSENSGINGKNDKMPLRAVSDSPGESDMVIEVNV